MQNPLTTAALVGGGRKNGKTKAAADSSDDAWKNDLRPAYYWCIAALVFFLKEAGVDDVLAWLPFSTTFQLLFFFWLQMPGFRGADYLFSRLLSALSSLLDAHLKQEPEPGQSGSRNQAGEAAETADPSSKPKVSKPGPVDDDEQRSIGEELKGDEAKASGRTGVVKSSQSEARSHKIERRRVVKDEAAGARRDETEDALTQRRSAPRKDISKARAEPPHHISSGADIKTAHPTFSTKVAIPNKHTQTRECEVPRGEPDARPASLPVCVSLLGTHLFTPYVPERRRDGWRRVSINALIFGLPIPCAVCPFQKLSVLGLLCPSGKVFKSEL
eukprot:scaffold1638_cov258-Pinguiococcus_pyrenoidosus.AAC.48